jgi:hypothetical protein
MHSRGLPGDLPHRLSDLGRAPIGGSGELNDLMPASGVSEELCDDVSETASGYLRNLVVGPQGSSLTVMTTG